MLLISPYITPPFLYKYCNDIAITCQYYKKYRNTKRADAFASAQKNTFLYIVYYFFSAIAAWAASNDCFVAASVVSLAEKGNEKLNDPGIDLFKIEDGKIQEVWTFAQYQTVEDKFWE